MPTLIDLSSSAAFTCLVYGRFGTGKTAGAATFPRPIILDFDRGTKTLKNVALELKYGYAKNVVHFETFREKRVQRNGVPISHNAYDDACRYFEAWMKEGGEWEGTPTGPSLFDTWVIDSGSTLGDYARNKAIILMGGERLSLTHDKAKASGLVLPKVQDFGAERALVEQFIGVVLDSGKNVVLTAHEKTEWSGEGTSERITGIVPMFTGQSVEKIPLKFDEVYNLRTKKEGPNVVRYLQTVPDGIRACRSRLGVPDGTLWEYGSIMKTLA